MRVDVGELLALELVFLACESMGVVRVEGLLQVGQAQSLGGFLDGRIVNHVAALEDGLVGVERIGEVVHGGDGTRLVGDPEELAAVGVVAQGAANDIVVRAHHVAELVARRVHHDARRGLIHEGDLHAAAGLGGRRHVSAKLAAHALDARADLLAEHNAVARGSGAAVERTTLVLRVVFVDHFLVGAEAARCQKHGLGGGGVDFATLALGDEARSAAVGHGDVGHLRAIDNGSAQGANAVDEVLHRVAAAALIATGSQVRGHAIGLVHAHAVEADANFVQPIDQGGRGGVQSVVIRHGAIEAVVFGNNEALEHAEHGVLVEERAGVEATERVVLLQLAAGAGEAGIRHGHRAAGDVLLLEKGDFEAFLEQAGRGGEACGACAHDHDVGVDGLVFALFGSLSALLELRDIGAGIGDGLDGGVLDSGARRGCARNGINVEVLGLDDLGRPHLGCKAANANGLVVGKHAQVRDGAARHGGFDVDVVLVAHGLGGELAVGRFFQRGGRGFCRRLRRFGLAALRLGALFCRGRAAQSNCAHRGNARKSAGALQEITA